MGKTTTEKSTVAQGFISIQEFNEISEIAQNRAKIIATLNQRIAGYEADIKGLSEKLKDCNNNDQVIVKDVKSIVTRMEYSFARGAEELGEITIEDIRYNLQLLNRILTNKYGRK